jgi:hypothetical protein
MILDCSLAAAERIFINLCLFVNVSDQFILQNRRNCTFICFGVSVIKMAEFGFDDDILPPAPCRAVRNLE